jgi:translation initiation factor 1 (eIF-1/SUI1)
MPPEYCEFAGSLDKCKQALLKDKPEMFKQIYGDAEVEKLTQAMGAATLDKKGGAASSGSAAGASKAGASASGGSSAASAAAPKRKPAPAAAAGGGSDDDDDGEGSEDEEDEGKHSERQRERNKAKNKGRQRQLRGENDSDAEQSGGDDESGGEDAGDAKPEKEEKKAAPAKKAAGGAGAGGGSASVLISKVSRVKNKYTTIVRGLESFGVNLKDAAKAFSKKFAASSTVVKCTKRAAHASVLRAQRVARWMLTVCFCMCVSACVCVPSQLPSRAAAKKSSFKATSLPTYQISLSTLSRVSTRSTSTSSR